MQITIYCFRLRRVITFFSFCIQYTLSKIQGYCPRSGLQPRHYNGYIYSDNALKRSIVAQSSTSKNYSFLRKVTLSIVRLRHFPDPTTQLY